jgi:hypothetical protein
MNDLTKWMATTPLGTRPRYVRQTLQEPVEPYYSRWRELKWELPYECPECGTPDPQWYTPTQELLDLQTRVRALGNKAFRTVPNPDYDPVRAAEWEEKRKARLNQTKFEWGQSYNEEITP